MIDMFFISMMIAWETDKIWFFLKNFIPENSFYFVKIWYVLFFTIFLMNSNATSHVIFCRIKAYSVIVNCRKNNFHIHDAPLGNRQNMICFLNLFRKTHFFFFKIWYVPFFTIFVMNSNASCYVMFFRIQAYNVIVKCGRNIFYVHDGRVGNRQNMIPPPLRHTL